MTSDANSEHDGLARVVDSLTKKFPDIPEDIIVEHVNQAHAPMAQAPLQEYVPVLVEHQVQVHLNTLEHDPATDPNDTPTPASP